jgi:hypothetical protein
VVIAFIIKKQGNGSVQQSVVLKNKHVGGFLMGFEIGGVSYQTVRNYLSDHEPTIPVPILGNGMREERLNTNEMHRVALCAWLNDNNRPLHDSIAKCVFK